MQAVPPAPLGWYFFVRISNCIFESLESVGMSHACGDIGDTCDRGNSGDPGEVSDTGDNGYIGNIGIFGVLVIVGYTLVILL